MSDENLELVADSAVGDVGGGVGNMAYTAAVEKTATDKAAAAALMTKRFVWPAIFHGRDETPFGSTLAEMVAAELQAGNQGLAPNVRSVYSPYHQGDMDVSGIGLTYSTATALNNQIHFALHNEQNGMMDNKAAAPDKIWNTSKKEVKAGKPNAKEKFVTWLSAQSDATLVTPWNTEEDFDDWLFGRHTATNQHMSQRLCRARFLAWLPEARVAQLAVADPLAAKWIKASREAAAAKDAEDKERAAAAAAHA